MFASHVRVAARRAFGTSPLLSYSEEVASALHDGSPVVALESTIISHGMPYPQNLKTAVEVEGVVREHGAVPATIALMDGHMQIGLEEAHLERLARNGHSAAKCSRRDLARVLATGGLGATTVSGTMIAAELAGIEVFVTGGIGGVHRGIEETLDVSADLSELGRTPVAVVCAGAKSILDIPRTLEYLETQGVAVMCWRTDVFPAFFTVDSGEKAPLRVEGPEEVADWLMVNQSLGLRSGAVVAVPNPEPADGAIIDSALQQALGEVRKRRIAGKEATPYLLRRLNELTGGASLQSNIALVRNNAAVGSRIAVARAAGRRGDFGSMSTRAFSSARETAITARRPLVIGGATVDIISRGAAEVMAGTSNIGRVQQSHGGAGRNVCECMGRLWPAPTIGDGDDFDDDDSLQGARRMCLPPVFASVAGDDDAGRSICRALADIGVDVSHVQYAPGQRTAIYNAMLGPDGNLVAAVADMDVLDAMDASMAGAVLDALESPRLIVADGNLAVDALASICARQGGKQAVAPLPIWFEPTSVPKATRVCSPDVLPYVELISPNMDELVAIASELGVSSSGATEIAAAAADGATRNAEALAVAVVEAMSSAAATAGAETTVRHVIVTLGPLGTVVASSSAAAEGLDGAVAVRLEPVGGEIEAMENCTGAGDCLLGAVATCVLRWPEMSITSAVRVGMAAASLTIQSREAVSPDLSPEWLEMAVRDYA